MLGSFTGIYRFILNFLPILLPSLPTKQSNNDTGSPNESLTPMVDYRAGLRRESLVERSSQLSISAQYLRKHSKRWHAAFAGFVAGGIGVSFESKSRRLVIGQQLFVRFVALDVFARERTDYLKRFTRKLQWLYKEKRYSCTLWCGLDVLFLVSSIWRPLALSNTSPAVLRSCMPSSCARTVFPLLMWTGLFDADILIVSPHKCLGSRLHLEFKDRRLKSTESS